MQPVARRRFRWHNELTTLSKYERLLKGARELREAVRTAELQEYAGLGSDLNGTLGALFMLEAVGVLYPVRGQRRQYIWHPGRRRGERPPKLPALLPYVRVPRLLEHFGRTPIGTVPIFQDVHFAPTGEKHGQRERLLGALKMLVALGLAGHDPDEAGWYFAGAVERRPYRAGMFGWESRDPIQVPFDEEVISAQAPAGAAG